MSESSQLCSFCCTHFSKLFCLCQDSPIFLCEGCLCSHIETFPCCSHESLPLAAYQHIGLPDYADKLHRRLRKNKQISHKLLADLSALKQWERTMCGIAEKLIMQMSAFRESISLEITALIEELQHDIDLGLSEFREKMYEPQPDFTSPIAAAIWNLKLLSIPILSCKTDFAEVRQAIDALCFALNLQLQVEIPKYSPRGTIRVLTDINPNRKVNIYEPFSSDFLTEDSKATVKRLGEYSLPNDLTPKIVRGPITIRGEDVYIGEWTPYNVKHGFGDYHWTRGMRYTGQWVNGDYEGKGRYVWSDGTAFEGEWRNHQRNGYGKEIHSKGTVKWGEWEMGNRKTWQQ